MTLEDITRELRRTFEQFTQLMGGKVDKNYDKLQYATLKLLGVLCGFHGATAVKARRPGCFGLFESSRPCTVFHDARRLSNSNYVFHNVKLSGG